MTKAEKNQQIDALAQMIQSNSNFYITDTSALNSDATSKLRRECYTRNIKMLVVKNTLLEKAMERTPGKYDEMFDSLKGNSSILFSESLSEPAKLIKEFRKKYKKPLLKSAFIDESIYIGDNQLESLASIKGKDELIGEIIGLLQSPAKNIISGLLSGGNKIAGVLETLAKRGE